jgi:hypothetical protein
MDKETLDYWFPTLVRYTGWVLMVVMVVAAIIQKGVDYPSGFVAAAGMILYKTVVNAVKNGSSNGVSTEKDEASSKEERWSHMP